LYVYEDLERAAGKLPFRVRLTEAKEDIESGTDIMVIVQDKESKDREIPVDAKSWGAFSKLVDKGEVRQLDRAGYFGIKENRQHQEVLVINPAGLNESQGLYSKEKIGNTNCHSFRRASNDNRFATATYHAIQRHMLPEQSSNRVFSATF
jgi:hypothetical protein